MLMVALSRRAIGQLALALNAASMNADCVTSDTAARMPSRILVMVHPAVKSSEAAVASVPIRSGQKPKEPARSPSPGKTSAERGCDQLIGIGAEAFASAE